MIGTLFAGGIISLLIAAITAYLLLRFMRQEIGRLHIQQQNQLQAQESQLQLWKSSQEKRLSDLEHQLVTQLQQLQVAQKKREEAEEQRFRTLVNQSVTTTANAHMEYELAQIPRIEDVPLPGPDHQQQHGFAAQRTPPNFQGRDLSRRDLSSRYLSHADLRQTKLSLTKLFMADLSWANLAEADLSGAELSAANLTYANLRGASLRGASFLVADLNHAILIGADLRDTHNLSLEQIATTLYDATTLFDPALARKLPQKARTHQPAEADRKSESFESPPIEADRKSESFENTKPIPVQLKKQEPQIPAEQGFQAPAEQMRQTPTGDVLPLENTVLPAYQTPLESPPSIDNGLPHPSQNGLATFSENPEAH